MGRRRKNNAIGVALGRTRRNIAYLIGVAHPSGQLDGDNGFCVPVEIAAGAVLIASAIGTSGADISALCRLVVSITSLNP